MDQSVGMAPWPRVVLAIVAVAGLAAVVAAERQAEHDADEREEALAAQAAMLIEGSGTASVTALAGAGGLVSTRGEVDLDSFATYAREVVDVSPIQALGFEPVVQHEDRVDFEAALGGRILDQRDGELVPASERPLYFPIRAIEPVSDAGRATVGFDILAEPVRGTAAVVARDTGRAVLTEPVRAASTGETSYFLIKPLFRPGAPLDTVDDRRAAHVGFVSTAYPGSGFAQLLDESLPEPSRFTLRDGQVQLAGTASPPRNGTTRSVPVGERRWTLVVEDGRSTDRSLLFAVTAFAVLLFGSLLVFFRRSAAHDAEVVRASGVIARTADVAQGLAAAASVEDVDHIIRSQLGAVVGAKGASLGLVDADRGVLRVSSSPNIDRAITARWQAIPLDQPVPITEVVRTATPLFLRTLDDWRAHGTPEAVADAERAGIVSAACLPLADRGGRIVATLAVSWDDEIDFDPTTRDTLRTLTELCEQSLARARVTDLETHSAQQLAQLAARLASAATVAEVLETITEAARSPVGASATSVGLIDRDAGVLRTHHGRDVSDEVRQQYTDPPLEAGLAFTDAARTGTMVLIGDHRAFAARYPDSAARTASLGFGARAALPLRDSEGSVVGSIVHAWAGPRAFDETLVSTLLTIADIAGQALERADLAETEHRLVTTLQGSLLAPLPSAQSLDLAARYLPSVAALGMGGDWYEGIVVDVDRYALILGDVAGHGITAVGDMAQLRAVIGALVRLGTPMDQVFAQATRTLQAAEHNPTASCLLVIIDTARQRLSYAAAGHPPPVVRSPSGEAVLLEAGRQPILGIGVDGVSMADHPFPPGALLIAYTDGLIERRGEPIDVSLSKLLAHATAAPPEAPAAAEHLLRATLHDLDPDDDVALVVVGHRG